MRKFSIIGLLFVASGLLCVPAQAATTYDMADPANWNFRFLGVPDSAAGTQSAVVDVNGDGENDLVMSAAATGNNSRASSGSVYIIYSSLFETFASSAPGTTLDLASSTNYNIRIDGAQAGDVLAPLVYGRSGSPVADVNGDGELDLVLNARAASNNSRAFSGSVYVLDSSLIPDTTDTGVTIDLAVSTSYSLRIDGAEAFNLFGATGVLTDISGDDGIDLVVGAPYASNNSRASSGSVYVVDNDKIGSYSGTGNTLDMASSSNFVARYDGAANENYLGITASVIGNIDGDAPSELFLFAPFASNNSRDSSGSFYILQDDLLQSDLASAGTIIDLATSTAYTVRYDGPSDTAELGYAFPTLVDLNDDGEEDFLVSANFASNNSRAGSGSLYVLYNDLLAAHTGTGATVDLDSSTTFSLRFDGPSASSYLSDNGVEVQDFNNDGTLDIEIGARGASPFGRLKAGHFYIIYHDVFGGASGTGNTFDLASSTNYNIRYDGAVEDDWLSDPTVAIADVNQDGLRDLVMNANADYDSGTGTFRGSLYVIHNFPHTLALDPALSPTPGFSYFLSGTVSATSSVTAIAGVAYRLDDPDPLASWTPCAAQDGSFNATSTETFLCTLTVPAGTHTIYIRAEDVNGVFTPQSNYLQETVTVSHDKGGGGRSGSSRRGSSSIVSSDFPASSTVSSVSPSPTPLFSYRFLRDLRVGVQGEDVRELQKYLNAHGFLLAASASGAGSPGQETLYFGTLTFNALVKFQEAYAESILKPLGLTKGTGFFGPATRLKIGSTP